jgi:cytochrome c biogenesis protein CcmG/thiol:disulfide interchange protein DsbE
VKSLRYLIPLAIFIALAVFLALGLKRDPREVPSPLIGKPAPDFMLARLDNPVLRLRRDDLLGQVWVLNVWASWCGPCREEHAVVSALARRGGVPVYGLNYKDRAADAQAWLRQFGNPYAATLVDPDGRAGIEWGVYGVPETFVIDRAGLVRFKHIGVLTEATVREKIEPLLAALRT